MKIKTGIDLVYLPKFRKSIKSAGSHFLKRVYLAEELQNQRATHLAGIFAAKEAVIKALGLPLDSWHSIKITQMSSGAPQVKITDYPPASHTRKRFGRGRLPVTNHSLSISHDGNYVVAQFVALL